MLSQDLSELLQSIKYIEGSSANIKDWVHKANDLIPTITNDAVKLDVRKDRLKEIKRLAAQIEELPVITVTGKKIRFKDVLARIKKETDKQTCADLVPRNFYQMSPFRELGELRVQSGSRGDKEEGPTIRSLFYASDGTATSSRLRVPSPYGRNPVATTETIFLNVNWSWWTAWPVYEHFDASASVTAKGWDAADIAGGEYALAKQLCLTLDPQGNVWLALLKAAACNYANNTPEVPFPVHQLKITACTCYASSASGDCFHYTDTDHCATRDVFGTAGPVKVETHMWGGPQCLFSPQMAVRVQLWFNGGGDFLWTSVDTCGNY